MALIKCSECSGKVSDTAKSCPHCGHALTFGRKGVEEAAGCAGWVWFIFLVIILGATVKGCMNLIANH